MAEPPVPHLQPKGGSGRRPVNFIPPNRARSGATERDMDASSSKSPAPTKSHPVWR